MSERSIGSDTGEKVKNSFAVEYDGNVSVRLAASIIIDSVQSALFCIRYDR